MAKKTETKKNILLAALDLFSQKGTEQTTLQDIATRLQIKPPAVYKHYSSKEEIIESVIRFCEEYYQQGTEISKDKLLKIDFQTFNEELIIKLIINQLNVNLHDEYIKKIRRFYACESYSNERVRGLLIAHAFEAPLKFVTGLIAGLIEAGIFKPVPKEQLPIAASELVSVVSMVLYRCDLEPEYEEEGLKFVQGAVEKFWQEHQKTKK